MYNAVTGSFSAFVIPFSYIGQLDSYQVFNYTE